MASANWFISKRWRSIKLVWILFGLELAFNIPALALFAIAQPNLYRTKLWEEGYKNQFNSNPVDPIYAMTNHVEYTYPVVWSQFLTDFNVVISILSVFLMLTKAVMFIMHIFYPIIGFIVHGGLFGVWLYSVWAQLQPDHSDPRFGEGLNAPWYIAKSCDWCTNKSNVHYCQQAKAALGITVVMMVLFLANTVLAIYSMIPTRAQRIARLSKLEMRDEEGKDGLRFDPPPTSSKQRHWEQLQSPKTPSQGMTMSGGLRSPATPRTKAFNALGGNSDLPLRND